MKHRKLLESLVWRFTHADFKGTGSDGVRRVLHRNTKTGGTESWPLSSFTDAELLSKLTTKGRAEYARRTGDTTP